MASKQMLVVAAVIAATTAFLPAFTFAATEHWVGDGNGWVLGFDYVAWAASKEFRVGDTLVFKYQGSHTVVEVSGPEFKTCTKPDNAVVWNSGEDRVPLKEEGRRWFFCGVGDHCQKNMKLNITVLAAGAPSPDTPPSPPAPSSPAGSVGVSIAQVMAVVGAAIAAVLVF